MRIIRNDQSYSSNLLTIEDPFDQTIDVGHRVWGLQRIKDEFGLAYITLTQEVCSSGKMNVKRYSFLFKKKVKERLLNQLLLLTCGRMLMVYFSILGRIIRITDDIIGHRKWIHNKFSVHSLGLMKPKYICSI